MPSRKVFAFFTPHFFYSQQLSLEKVHNAGPNGDDERRGGDMWFPAWV